MIFGVGGVLIGEGGVPAPDERCGLWVFPFPAKVAERALLIIFIGGPGARRGDMAVVLPTGIVEGPVPARNAVLIDVLVREGECGIRSHSPIRAKIQVLFRIAAPLHASGRRIFDIAKILGGKAEPNPEFTAHPAFHFQTANVAALAVGAVFISGRAAGINLIRRPRAEIR